MKAATQRCSGKKELWKFRQNPQKTPAKEPILYQSHRLEVCKLTTKEPPSGIPMHWVIYYVLEIQEHPFSRTSLNGHFHSKYYRKLNISLVKKNEWLIKTTGWLKKFDNKFITSLFKLLELLILILKKMGLVCKDNRRVQISGWKSNGNAGENVQWSLHQFHIDT